MTSQLVIEATKEAALIERGLFIRLGDFLNHSIVRGTNSSLGDLKLLSSLGR